MTQRLDRLLVARGLVADLATAVGLIMTGKVLVGGRPVVKPGAGVADQVEIRLKDPPLPWVSRGALKLEAALDGCGLEVNGLVCLDVGASTGGFTDLLLSRGAARVFAVDVGYGQLAWKLVQDPRVVVMDRCNIRQLKPDDLAGPVDFLTMDISFMSLAQALPAAVSCLREGGTGVVLIKPQFELPREMISKGGVVMDPALHQQAIDRVRSVAEGLGLTSRATLPSPIVGPAGNREFLYCFDRIPGNAEKQINR
ncbi:MAG: TlyA family RNA methyltransferase [Magnetococcales bacterium]|nr:TlyA family RNA methyltransferase [Magnetococcales bacterium]